MIDTINIGSYIYDRLSTDSSLMEMVTKIVPMIADNNTLFPFVTYRRTSLLSYLCKDGTYQDEVNVEIAVVSVKYSIGVQIATRIRQLLQIQYIRYNNMEINDGCITNASEEYNSTDNAYIQRITFNFKIND